MPIKCQKQIFAAHPNKKRCIH